MAKNAYERSHNFNMDVFKATGKDLVRLKQNSKANQLPSGSDLLKEVKVSIIIVTFNSLTPYGML